MAILIRPKNFYDSRALIRFRILSSLTLFAGKFTPAARVEVQQITEMVPARNASSNSRRSSLVKPKIESIMLRCNLIHLLYFTHQNDGKQSQMALKLLRFGTVRPLLLLKLQEVALSQSSYILLDF